VNPEQQRIAIAEACGWTKISDWKAAGINGQHPTEPWTEVIPDYLNDLNAMHEAETLVIYSNDKSPKKYTQQIKAAICKDAGVKKAQMDFDMCITATAAQRAEAFLKTIGKWKKPCNL
jgi:hypothetical protein